MKFSKNDEFEFTGEDENDLKSQMFHNSQKRPRGRPKGSKNKPKDEKVSLSKTPKKKISFLPSSSYLPPQPPNKVYPSKNTTPSPPLPALSASKVSPVPGLSFGLAPLVPSMQEMTRPESTNSSKHLSDSSSSD